jgi:hypothetical protein
MKKHTVLFLWFVILTGSPAFSQPGIPVDSYDNNFADWKIKEFKGRADFQIDKTPRPMITLKTENSNFMLAKELKDLDIIRYPFLIFEWRVERHPAHGDLRQRETDDQAAGLYVTLPSFPETVNFKSIGYVWENSAPPGIYPSLSSRNIKYMVLRSGPAGLGEWHREQRNVLEDFKKVWGVDIRKKQKLVISLAADSDGTRSSSRASFGRIGFSKNPSE